MEIEWRYRESRGPYDSVAPTAGGYWIADVGDFVARVWHSDEIEAYVWDVYDGGYQPLKTPETNGHATTRAMALEAAGASLAFYGGL